MNKNSKLLSLSSKVQRTFLEDRQVYMGFAIVLVIIYHLECIFHFGGYVLSHILGKGYVGVDIFVFLSGLGLCYSLSRNSLLQYYQHRLIRIMPLFFIVALLHSVVDQITNGGLSVWDYVCNLTTLSYYGIGGTYSNWFISAILVLYLFFPLVFKYVKGGGYFTHMYNKRSDGFTCTHVLDI